MKGSTMTMNRQRCGFLPLLVCLVLAREATASPRAVSQPLERRRQVQEEEVTVDPTAAYALYSLPPFTITFTSSFTTHGLPADPNIRSPILRTALYSPLRMITSEFLLESFRIEISKMNPHPHDSYHPTNTLSPEDAHLRAMLDSFMSLDLQVAVRVSDHLSLTSSGHDDGRGQRMLVQTDQEELYPATTAISYAASGTNAELLQFEADFFTTAAFLEPIQDVSKKPSNQMISDLLGGWIRSSFETDHDVYKADLQNSEEGILKHLENLHIQTDSGAAFDPFATGTVPIPNVTTPIQDSPLQPPDSPDSAAAKTSGVWTLTEKLFLTLLISVSLLSIIGLSYALKKFIHRNKELDRMMESDFLGRFNSSNFNDTYSLGGRHSDEVLDILNASDRYLAEHRPDLLQAMQKTDEIHRLVIPVASHPEDTSSRPVERRYVTTSSPFSYLYGASYFHSQRTAVEQDRLRSRQKDPMEGVELQPESVPDDEDLDLTLTKEEQVVSGFMQSWFRRVVGARTTRGADEEHGFVNSEMDVSAMEECVMHQTLACDEDPAQYDFAYQDFPRPDGTPCLIYEETLNEEEEEQYLRNSRRDSLHSTTTYGVQDPLTDEEFRRALSQRSLMDYQTNNNSFELSDNKSLERDATDLHSLSVGVVDEVADRHDDDDETNPVNFTDRLERLVSMRHRHYEKQQIVERHREQRRQERARQRAEKQTQQQEEMQKRDRQLRRHSLELEIQELEAIVSTGAPTRGAPYSAAKLISPTEPQAWSSGHRALESFRQKQPDLPPYQEPNSHRRTSSDAALKISPVISGAEVAAIPKTRSMDWEEGFSSENNGASTKGNPPKRLIQLAFTKPQTGSAVAYEDVFRRVDGVFPVSTSPAFRASRKMTLPPSQLSSPPIVSPASSSMTDTGSSPGSGSVNSRASTRSTPPVMLGSSSIRDGSSARRKTGVISSASAALAKGFHARRSMSFGNLEEKKTDENIVAAGSSSGRSKKPLPPRALSNGNSRANPKARANVVVHGAQFAS